MIKEGKKQAEDSGHSFNKAKIFVLDYINLLAAVFALILIFIGYWFFLQPKFTAIIEISQKERASRQEEKISKEKELKELLRIGSFFSEIKNEDKEKAEKMFVRQQDLEAMLGRLEALVLKSGLLMNNIKISPLKEDESGKRSRAQAEEGMGEEPKSGQPENWPTEVGKIEMSLTVSGTDYQGLKKFLAVLENNLALIDVIEINFSPAGEETSLRLLSYYYKGGK